MTKQEVDALVAEFASKEGLGSDDSWDANSTQFESGSAAINYSMVRQYKPQVVVEFGSRTGRCTHDILRALEKNNLPFVFKSYELDESLRADSQRNMDKIFGKGTVTIGGDITKAEDIPDNVEYLFVDNNHDIKTTQWVFDYLLPTKCKPGCLVQIHDLPLQGDFEKGRPGQGFPETDYLIELHKQGKLPLEKIYWAWENSQPMESTWWRYTP